MKILTKLLIPIGLGVLAFGLNWMAVQPQMGRDFVTVNQDVALDKELTESQLAQFKIVGQEFDHLKQTLVPWEERTALLGLPVRRDLKKGDVVLWQDVRYLSADFLPAADELPLHISLEGVDYEPSLLKVGNQVGIVVPVSPKVQATGDGTISAAVLNAELNAQFEELGPFRILSIGERTLQKPGESDSAERRKGDEKQVTLAIKLPAADVEKYSAGGATGSRPVPEAARKLLAAQNATRPNGKNLVGMVLYQDVDRLKRMRTAAAEAAKKAEPAATPTAAASATGS